MDITTGRSGVFNITGGTISGTTVSSNTFSTSALNSNIRTTIQQGGVPLIGPGSFTMGNNGAITLGTALPITYTNCYLYMLAGDIAAGVPASAGWYFCQMSSTTVGTVFNNTYTSGIATVPGSPTAFSTTGPGARTGDTGAETAYQITIPILAANSQIIASTGFHTTNNANNKTFTMKLGATTFHTGVITSISRTGAIMSIQNLAATNKQQSMFPVVGVAINASGEITNGAIDTSATTTLAFTMQRATATDNFVFYPPHVEAVG